MRRRALVLLLLAPIVAPTSLAADDAAVHRARRVIAIRDYREALERVRMFDEAAMLRARREVERRRELPSAIISRRELEDSERALAAAETKLEQTRAQILAADHTIMEVLAEARAPRRSVPERPDGGVTLVRHRGRARWTLTEVPKVQVFFESRFGRPLPVSAFGQTPLHDRLGFDHHDAIDVAVLPDSVEGAALMEYLRAAGYSFLAYRAGVVGEATGAHIHIGEASRRF